MGHHGARLILRWHPPLRRTRAGTYEVSLHPEDRELLRSLPAQLRAAIAARPDDHNLRRLFPPAYTSDPEAEREYRRLMGTDLDESRSRALDTLASTAGAAELSKEQLDDWVRALNAIRLWLGTVLDVSEDEPEDVDDPGHLLYTFLTALQSSAIDALSGTT
ncbi:MAG: DUF2017 family protein [Acidimicrobiales bacterium]